MEWMLDTDSKAFDGKTESEFLAQSIKDVTDHYGSGLLDDKTLDWCNLIQCLAIVYGGRIFAIRSKPKASKPRPQPTAAQTAAQFSAPTGAVHRTPAPVNNFSDSPSVVEIAGLGAIDLGDDNPLSPTYRKPFN
jgi:hypothetical protein